MIVEKYTGDSSMDARIDVPDEAAAVETVRIDRLVGPFRWVKWNNVGLLWLAVSILLEIISSVLRGNSSFYSSEGA